MKQGKVQGMAKAKGADLTHLSPGPVATAGRQNLPHHLPPLRTPNLAAQWRQYTKTFYTGSATATSCVGRLSICGAITSTSPLPTLQNSTPNSRSTNQS
ncbi:hypothetical protein BHE74_00025219 [Ensete ventricosum]|nr:hypothetical protein BHE74_00025219 [Ensete ventricosum]